ncbi:hypothetical protein EIP91_007447 [Steccherinum ochraceum]|uniref:Transmembrane protein n=1 Tax=Steccherinum ochraceum TaxID=92696 RepID=A0A4V2MXC0_9APHY|nr:hypothetical protein EIP91_007447 [Steccherinum ochraceum]
MENSRPLSTGTESLSSLPKLQHRFTAQSDVAPLPATEEKKDVGTREVARQKEQKSAEAQTDLLLDVAMTTTFASLLDGTPISDGKSLASFVSLFALVWWVWASEVAYNARFRKYDWIHRVFLFLQLLIFCAFAAFTNGFDITAGIIDDTGDEATLMSLRLTQGWPVLAASAQASREARIPIFSVRGIAMTMAFSRVLLFFQYVHAFFHFKLEDQRATAAFYVHNGSLLISFTCYFASFFVISSNPDKVTRDDQIAKVCLWYTPIILEAVAHFLAAHLSEDKQFEEMWYKGEVLYGRSASVFIIILGAGLDKITQGFHFLVGNPAFGGRRIGVIFSATLIFICIFSLYFTDVRGRPLPSTRTEKQVEAENHSKRRRVLIYFFLNFLYLCAVIITLQGMAAMIQFGNVGDNMDTAFEFLRTSEQFMNSTNFVVPVDVSIYDADLVDKLSEAGYSITELVDDLNEQIPSHVSNVSDYSFRNLLLTDFDILTDGLHDTNAVPTDENSLLANEIRAFWNTSDNTDVTKPHFIEIAQLAISSNATPALWFFAAGGSVLVMLAILSILNHTDEMNGYIIAQVAGRLTLGTLMLLLTALDAHAIAVQITDDYRFFGSRIWRLASQNWILPPYAIVLAAEQVYEYVLMYLSHNAADSVA